MTEEFVTLETAKLLKEKGFKEDVFTFYEVDCVEGDMILSETYDESENFNEKMIVFLHLHNLSPRSGYVKPKTFIYVYITVLVAMDTKYLKLTMELI